MIRLLINLITLFLISLPAKSISDTSLVCIIKNQPIQPTYVDSHMLHTLGIEYGGASIVDNRYFILLDAKMTPPLSNFVFFHECSHHILRHTNNNTVKYNRRSLRSNEKEYAADCVGIKLYIETFGKQYVAQSLPYIKKTLDNKRFKKIMQCYND